MQTDKDGGRGGYRTALSRASTSGVGMVPPPFRLCDTADSTGMPFAEGAGPPRMQTDYRRGPDFDRTPVPFARSPQPD